MSGSAKIGRDLRAAVSKTLADVMTLATDNLVALTPKDTTHASKNWIPSVGSPHGGVDGTQESPSDAAQQEGLAALRRYDVGRDGKLFIRNNVDYVEHLNERNDSAGFVTEALQAASAVAPRGSKGRVRKLLRGMAASAYKKGV